MFFLKNVGFFDPKINKIPAGAVRVSDAAYKLLMKEQAGGRVISADGDGNPILTDRIVTWDEFRSKRNKLLQESDWTQLPDAVLSAETKSAWAQYRQTLRDLPETFADPLSIVWPTAPS